MWAKPGVGIAFGGHWGCGPSPRSEDETKPTLDDVPFVTATIGRIYLEQGHLDRAEAVFRQLLVQRPQDPALDAGLREVARRRAQTAEDRAPATGVSTRPARTAGPSQQPSAAVSAAPASRRRPVAASPPGIASLLRERD